jgi:hypothetical protein
VLSGRNFGPLATLSRHQGVEERILGCVDSVSFQQLLAATVRYSNWDKMRDIPTIKIITLYEAIQESRIKNHLFPRQSIQSLNGMFIYKENIGKDDFCILAFLCSCGAG